MAKKARGKMPRTAVPPATRSNALGWRPWAMAVGALVGLTGLMFSGVLLAGGERVLSNRETDLFHYFIHWRQFGFAELRHGNLALWNPHYFSGTPFFGGFQSGLLYPLNLLFVVLPPAQAVNWSIALHVFLAGAFTLAWATRRGLHPLACFLSAVMFMFCGAHFLRIYAGHLPILCALVWIPLLFLAIDGLFERPTLGWSLVGMLAMGMQVLAGHPQYVFYAGMVAAAYCGLHWYRAQERWRCALGLAGVVLGGLGLSAVQILAGLEESRETLRSGALPYQFAGICSLPPESLLTLLAPNFFGGVNQQPYWGRWYPWEVSLFAGVTGLALAAVGAIWGERRTRRFALVMVALSLLLALGRYTPLFKVLYHWLPGFDRFRGSGKFALFALLFLALLAGIGLDRLLRGLRVPKALPLGVILAAAALCALGLAVRQMGATGAPGGFWQDLLLAIRNTGEGNLPRAACEEPELIQATATRAGNSLWLCAGTLAVVGGLLLGTSRWQRQSVRALAFVAVAELFWFGWSSLDTFDLSETRYSGIKAQLDQHPGEYRILNRLNPNAAMTLPAEDVGGDDPGVLRRYAELIAFSQAQDPDKAGQFIPDSLDRPLPAMLRCRFMFIPQNDAITIYETTNAVLRLQLVSRYRLLTNRTEILTALTNASFNPREEVILESLPRPEPVPTFAAGLVRLLDSSTDHLTIEAEVRSPSLLLVTDAYAKGWRARPLEGTVQREYQVLPANYCLRAVPLAAGHHHLRLEYKPTGFVIGRWISAVSLAVFLGLVCFQGSVLLRQRRSAATSQS